MSIICNRWWGVSWAGGIMPHLALPPKRPKDVLWLVAVWLCALIQRMRVSALDFFEAGLLLTCFGGNSEHSLGACALSLVWNNQLSRHAKGMFCIYLPSLSSSQTSLLVFLFAACSCDPWGSVDNDCSPIGQCQCHSNYIGRTCNQCAPGFFGYPTCTGESLVSCCLL